MPTKTTSVRPNTTTDLQNQIDSLTQELEAERTKTRNFGAILGQMRYRVTDKDYAEKLKELLNRQIT